MNKPQKENTAKTLLDISKAIIIAFIIGGFIPNSPLKLVDMILAGVISITLYSAAMILLGGLKE